MLLFPLYKQKRCSRQLHFFSFSFSCFVIVALLWRWPSASRESLFSACWFVGLDCVSKQIASRNQRSLKIFIQQKKWNCFWVACDKQMVPHIVCVCVWERESESEREWEREKRFSVSLCAAFTVASELLQCNCVHRVRRNSSTFWWLIPAATKVTWSTKGAWQCGIDRKCCISDDVISERAVGPATWRRPCGWGEGEPSESHDTI